MTIFHSLSFGIISLCCLLHTSHSTICQADAGVCEASASNKQCQNGSGYVPDVDNKDHHDEAYELAQSMIKSLQKREGGFFHEDKIEVRRRIPGDASSPMGIYAKDDISSDVILLKFPGNSLIRIEPSGSYEQDICRLKDELVEEMHEGEDSEFKDYIDYLLLETPTIPAAWSNQGQYLLYQMLSDGSDETENNLPPREVTLFYGIECFDDETEAENLLYLTLMRGYDNLMAPIYDIINHSNHPDKINIKNTSVRRRQGFTVSSTRFIKKGEELFHSYNRCLDCAADADVFGTPEIFRNHGFIEDYPQRFELVGGGHEDTSFDIVKVNNTLAVEWLKAPFFNGGRIPTIRLQLHWLDHFKNELLLPSKSSLDKMEWDLLNEYCETLIVALSLALSDAEEDKFEENFDLDFDSKDEYMLPEDTHVIHLIDRFRDAIYQSETLVWAFDHFKHLDTLQSQYQSIEYYKEPKTKDVCFFIDTIFQMCGVSNCLTESSLF